MKSCLIFLFIFFNFSSIYGYSSNVNLSKDPEEKHKEEYNEIYVQGNNILVVSRNIITNAKITTVKQEDSKLSNDSPKKRRENTSFERQKKIQEKKTELKLRLPIPLKAFASSPKKLKTDKAFLAKHMASLNFQIKFILISSAFSILMALIKSHHDFIEKKCFEHTEISNFSTIRPPPKIFYSF